VNEVQSRRGVTTALRCLSLYQVARAGRPTSCRFRPSCSAYATEAITEHGLVRGGLLAIRRLARCTPLSRPGVDLVPPAHSGAAR
jgi:putative membrane protein insertion efficiency factor